MGRHHVGHDQVRIQDAAQAHPTAADLLDDKGIGRDIQLQTAVLLRDNRSEQAQLLHPLHQLEGVFVGVFHILRHGLHLPAYELPDGGHHAALRFG